MASSSQKVEETLNRINTHMGVLGVIIVNKKGVAIKSTMNQEDTINNGALITQFMDKAHNTICALFPKPGAKPGEKPDTTEEITFIKIRSTIYEIMIAPDREFTMIVIQDPSNAA